MGQSYVYWMPGTLFILDLSIVNASLRMLPSEYASEPYRKYNSVAENYPWPDYGVDCVDPADSYIIDPAGVFVST